MDHPAHAAMVPMAAGAVIGKVGRFREQGNFYTGGVPRTLFAVWLYGVDNPLRALLPRDLKGELRARVPISNALGAGHPEVDWPSTHPHLPSAPLLPSLSVPPAIFHDLFDLER